MVRRACEWRVPLKATLGSTFIGDAEFGKDTQPGGGTREWVPLSSFSARRELAPSAGFLTQGSSGIPGRGETSKPAARLASAMSLTDARSDTATTGVFTLRVRYVECDPMGVAHHASYLPWFEEARTEMLRQSGQTYEQMEREGAFLVVADLRVRYRRPIKYDDVLEIRTELSDTSTVRLCHRYEIRVLERASTRVSTGEIVTTAETTLVCVDAEGRPRPLPEFLRPR